MKRKTVSQRLAYRLDRLTKQEIVDEWADKKAHEVQQIKDKLEYAWQHDDNQAFQEALDSLLDHKLKAMTAVKNIAKHLIYSPYKEDE